MRSPELFAAELEDVDSLESFIAKGGELRGWEKEQVFEVLLDIASDNQTYPWPLHTRAADLLVHIDPPCPMSCREVILRIANAHHDWSCKTIPFYLVTQFGKSTVQRVVKEIEEDATLGEKVRSKATNIGYWAKAPASYLNQGGFFGGFWKGDADAKEIST